MTHNYCLICLKKDEQDLEMRKNGDFDSNKFQILHFLKLWQKYTASKPALKVLKSHPAANKYLFSCTDCNYIISKFCEKFIEFDILRLKLSGILDSLLNIMTTANQVLSMRNELKNIAVENGENLDTVFKETRSNIIWNSREKLQGALPRIFISPVLPQHKQKPTNMQQNIKLKAEFPLQEKNIGDEVSDKITDDYDDNCIPNTPLGSRSPSPILGANLAIIKNEPLEYTTLHSFDHNVNRQENVQIANAKVKLESSHTSLQRKTYIRKRRENHAFTFHCTICKLTFVSRWKYLLHVQLSRLHKYKKQAILQRLKVGKPAKIRMSKRLRNNIITKSEYASDCDDTPDWRATSADDDSYTSETSTSSESSFSESITPKKNMRRTAAKRSTKRKKIDIKMESQREKCTICKVELSISKMKRHHKLHHDTKNIDPKMIKHCTVKDCAAYFLNSNQRCHHIKIVHKTERLHCQEEGCSLTFGDKTLFKRHQRQHGKFKCNFCDVEKNYAPDMAMHEQQHVMERRSGYKFQCSRCKYATNNKSSFIYRHFSPRHLTQVNRCPVCFKVFGNPGYLRRHKADVHNTDSNKFERGWQCNMCAAHFRKYNQLNLHKMKTHWNKKCPKCDFTWKGKHPMFQLKRHIQREHKEIFPELPFQCPVCKLLFGTQTQLATHLSTHKESYQCSKCEASYKSKISLYIHEKAAHEERRFVCAQCGKKFAAKAILESHMEYHKNPTEWQFACETCGKKFAAKYKLEEHQRTHTQEKPYVCEYCGQKYGHRHNWRNHMKTKHDAEPPKILRRRKRDMTECLSRKGAKKGDCVLSGARK